MTVPGSDRPTFAARVLDVVREVLLSPFMLGILVIACLVVIDWHQTNHIYPWYGFLRWNMFLAVVPLVLSYVLAWAARRDWTLFAVPFLALAWIVFLPNAPYLISDLVHLQDGASRANVLTLGLVAVTGLLIGVKSVQIVQRVIEERFGSSWGWRAVQAIVVLTTFGVYLGRVLRWNSWNVLSRPHALLETALRGPSEPRRLAIALVATLLSAVAFYGVYCMLTARQTPELQTASSPPSHG
jgi:uncharacterized membrane protein